jgi:hypothetical protein
MALISVIRNIAIGRGFAQFRKSENSLTNLITVSNGNCASTCAMFSTVMNERHQTKIGVFGGRPGQQIEFKGGFVIRYDSYQRAN